MTTTLTTRVAPLPATAADLPPLNIFRTLAHNDSLLREFVALGSRLLSRRRGLPPREREIVILRVGWRSQSEYEFGQHTRIGRDAGLTDAEIAALADAGGNDWSPADEALIRMVDELCADNVVSEETWAALAQTWSSEQLLELLVLAGYYRLVSGLLNSAGVPLEPGASGWPSGAAARLAAPRAES